jgi:CO/xanthine dehydrogenase Mo-binding subunit
MAVWRYGNPEDVAAMVTLRTGRPARLEYTREQEFVSARTRHPMRIRVRLGAAADGTLHAIDMQAISNTGAYGAHGLTVLSNTGSKTLPLYNKAPHVSPDGKVVHHPPAAGAYRGYGGTQGSRPSRPQWTNWRTGWPRPRGAASAQPFAPGDSPIFEELGEAARAPRR